MKVCIHGQQIRFRISPSELEALKKHRSIASKTVIPQNGAPDVVLHYVVRIEPAGLVSDFKVTGEGMELILSSTDIAQLVNADKEGIFIRKECSLQNTNAGQFVAYIEIDKVRRKPKFDLAAENNQGILK